MSTHKQFRLTRPDVYPPNTPGYLDKSARQGYYSNGKTLTQALQSMRDLFPEDSCFDVECDGLEGKF